MVEREDPVENGVELKELLNKGKPGLEHSAAGQGTSSCSNSDADQQNVENGLRQREEGSTRGRQRFPLCSSNKAATLLKKLSLTSKISISITIFVTFVSIISVSLNFIQHGENLKLAEKLKQLQSTTALPHRTPCPPKWIKNATKCYLFSDTQGTRNSSQSNCALYGATLATIHSREEWAFLRQHRRPTEYWLDLRRNSVEEPWAWPNGSLVDDWFHIGGTGLCGYLNEKAASSTNCDNDRSWICSMPVSSSDGHI